MAAAALIRRRVAAIMKVWDKMDDAPLTTMIGEVLE